MSRRSASLRRGQPHVPVEHPDVPGCCAECNRPIAVANDRHVDQLPETPPDVRDAEARRFGERGAQQ
jgi:hypothetical protein